MEMGMVWKEEVVNHTERALCVAPEKSTEAYNRHLYGKDNNKGITQEDVS